MPTRAPDPQREMLSLVTARVRDAYLRKPHIVDGRLDLVAVCRELADQGLTHTLVQDRGDDGASRLGIFTTTDLRDALLRPEPPAGLAVRAVARFELIEIDADADLFEALWLMVRHRIHRLVVRDGGSVIGVLEQLDLVSFVANHSHIVARQLDEAGSLDALKEVAQRIEAMVVLMHEGGTRVERIARLVGELNRRLIARLWSQLAPAELVAQSCLLVMGSEGRGEQLLRTDQDNALLLRDDYAGPDPAPVAARFSAALVELGWPPCPGGIMLDRPEWRGSVTQFRETLHHWVYGADPSGVMRLAIFLDAGVAAGDPALLEALRSHLDRILVGGDVFYARFAAAADQFDEPGHWWSRLTARADEQPLDLKKLGSFPIVHGVRALALQQRVHETGTAARLRRLVEQRQLDAALGADLIEALHYLMGLKLRHQLHQRDAGQTPSNQVRPSDLSTMDRDQLKDALAIVRRFRLLLRLRFRLDEL